MKTILILMLCIIVLSARGQITFKLYENIDYLVTPQTEESTSTLHYSRLSFGVQFRQEKKYFHEIELSYAQKAIPILYTNLEDGPYDSDKDYIGIQYEINRLISRQDNRLRFSVGAGTLLYYLLERRTPYINDWYYNEHQYLGVTVNLVPRLSYEISSKFTVELSGKIGLFDVRQYWRRINNPALPVLQQETSTTEVVICPTAYTLRIGIGYRL